MIIKKQVSDYSAFAKFLSSLEESNSCLKTLFDKVNCFFAGGFPRLLLRTSIENQAATNDYSSIMLNYFFVNGGDIDIFFTSADDWFKASRIFSELKIPVTSETDFAKSFLIKNDLFQVPEAFENYTQLFLKVQFVKLCEPTIESTLEKFDLYNSMVGFNKENLWFYENLAELELNKQLDICSISLVEFVESDDQNLQIILGRLLKYSQKYGYNSLSEQSVDKLQDFLTKRVMLFGQEYKISQFCVEFFKNKKFFTKENIIKFVGVLGKTVRNTYTLNKDKNGIYSISKSHGSYEALFDRALQTIEEINKEEKITFVFKKNMELIEKRMSTLEPSSSEWAQAKSDYLNITKKYEERLNK